MTNQTVDILKHFIGKAQLRELMSLSNQSEEADYFHAMTEGLALRLQAMPQPYAQDSKGAFAIAHLHYFKGGSDWWIIERDNTPEQIQAFGLASLNGQEPELGYISIQELIANGVELDLYWQTKTLEQIQAERKG